ncbi:glycosyltransferase family 4 protein [Rhodocytophaga rosea]|uniref:Glycosyltransferase family 4 protein n=1 Tax=Rhodocytophaga rosea TaxID=2704465 RepID=A0A6C0GH27_9BACT|nr:glycosyltransferase family 4 protein [Rhodocytophaga rosea]QHT67124.1 glycosyltransferase family 4 protein [Rhodocytophaga rosea]
MKKVLIIQRLLPHYRADFFNRLKQKLDAQGVELTLLYGKDEKSAKKDEVEISWATYIPTRTFHLGKIELFWQPGLDYLKDKELVIIEQANKNLINYLLIARRQFTNQKIAYWGHGRNRQTQEDSFRNSFKKFFINQCDWWFAYTQQVKDFLVSQSFPQDKITCVQNAVDTSGMLKQYATVSDESLTQLRNELGISETDQVAIFCGGIYKEKRISFLIEACDLIKKSIPNFHIVVVGSGTDAHLVTEAAQSRKWIHYVGPKFGIEKVKHFKISSLFLMPGLLGLAVLDSFALQTPTITTTYPYHSPEIEYLEHNINGIITEDNVQAYANAVVELLQADDQRKKLVEGCRISAGKYTVEQMAENFANGIIKCLQ